MTFGNRCDWRMLRNSKVSCIILKRDFEGDEMIFNLIHTISKPKEPSTMSNNRSAIFPSQSYYWGRRCIFDKSRFILSLTTPIGPFASIKVYFA